MFQTDNARYLHLVKKGRALNANEHNLPPLKVALLADHATQQMTHVLKATIAEAGFYPDIYEADYGTAAFEIYDRQSALYGFAPDFVVISFAVQKYRDRFLGTTSAQEREVLPQNYVNELLALVDAARAGGLTVIANNFALPIERMFGNYGLQSSQSLYGSVIRFNTLLSAAITERKGCAVNDIMYLSHTIGGAQFFDEKLWISSKYICATRHFPQWAGSLTRIMTTQKGKVTKCLVLDLDNTLWGGIIGDDGLDGIALGGDAYGEAYQLFQRYILSLKNRGYILAVCSKNNEDTALSAFRQHPEMIIKEEDIAVFVANWNDKASNIEYIARVLNIGLDSLIFIDDSAFERNQVATTLPQVRVPEMPEDVADYIPTLEASGYLEALGYSNEDAKRNQQYREEAVRTTEQLKYNNIDDYLKALDMKIDCGPFAPDQLPRVAQLIQRSNQFNLRTQRVTEAECERMMKSGDHVTVQARLRDKFGDYGLISVICGEVADNTLNIVELVMSCRVLKRGVEDYLMSHLFSECAQRGLKGIRGEYIPSAKNAMVKDFYKQFGFTLVASDGGKDIWYLDAAQYTPRPTFIEKITA
ncbi:MAG: HAD family hydrolase [Alphaproteobacteria bacterium]|nr:HAD family hydrolase [Alphaproteobacteria bacterium]MBV8549051.1 HAD family hydrolase [Alphaproteobacteria bacterium]